MTNHVHLLLTAPDPQNISLLMQYIGRRYVPYINHKYGKSGSIWEGRYKASLVQEEGYFLKVMRYIELNPVRANMVDLPNHYRWSSFHHNIGGKKISFLSFHPIYLSLGACGKSRGLAYKAMFEGSLNKTDMKHIRGAWQTGTPLGNSYFRRRPSCLTECVFYWGKTTLTTLIL